MEEGASKKQVPYASQLSKATSEIKKPSKDQTPSNVDQPKEQATSSAKVTFYTILRHFLNLCFCCFKEKEHSCLFFQC